MILGQLGMRFIVDPSEVPEPNRNPGEKMSEFAIRVARLKAEETARRHKSGIVLAADTIVVCGNNILGKPSDKGDAGRMLNILSGRWHEVISGICLLDIARHSTRNSFSRTRVHFRRLSPAEIEWYLKSGEYRDKAGAYGAQGRASIFIDKIDGCFFNVVGLPVAAFNALCRKSGIDLTQEFSAFSRQQSAFSDDH